MGFQLSMNMNCKYLFLSPFIPGWFFVVDMLLIKSILDSQERDGINGELVELGAYCGKSSIWIALCKPNSQPYLFDIFDNSMEAHSSQVYKDLYRSKLETWLERFRLNCHILSQDSSHLPFFLRDKKIQLIHIDASHLTSDVLNDLINAESLLIQGGFIVIDDWMNPGDPGVSKAIWKFLTESKLSIAFCSPNKMYLTTVSDFHLLQPYSRFLRKKLVYVDYDLAFNIYYLKGFVSVMSKFLSLLGRVRVKSKLY